MESSNSKVITCQAAVVWKAGERLTIEDIQVDLPKSNEVRIKILLASFCHTDILGLNGDPIPLFPRVLAHEGVGMIESVGENVTNLKEGDIVMPLYLGECKECPNCKSGRSNLCHKYPTTLSFLMLDGTSRMSIHGGKMLACFVVDTTGYGATWREVHVEKGSMVVVLGLGAIGHGVVEGARSQGASKIIGVDINKLKRAKGEAFAMTDFINAKDNGILILEMIKGVTGGLGVDYFLNVLGFHP